jgi:hypothetical protein
VQIGALRFLADFCLVLHLPESFSTPCRGETTMEAEELKTLEKAVRKAKRIATEKAGELHDLVEDRLPAAYDEIPGLAQATYDACKAWAEANARLQDAAAQQAGAS